MKKLLTIVSMALAFVTAVAMSAFCANVAGKVSGLARQPLSGVQLSLANPSVQLLARAGADSSNDPLLTPEANAASMSDKEKEKDKDKHRRCKDGERDDGDGHCVKDHCKDGERDDEHEHCVTSPSE
jgi:hypothetical protein